MLCYQILIPKADQHTWNGSWGYIAWKLMCSDSILILTSRSHPGNDTYISISDHGTSDAGRQRNVALKAWYKLWNLQTTYVQLLNCSLPTSADLSSNRVGASDTGTSIQESVLGPRPCDQHQHGGVGLGRGGVACTSLGKGRGAARYKLCSQHNFPPSTGRGNGKLYSYFSRRKRLGKPLHISTSRSHITTAQVSSLRSNTWHDKKASRCISTASSQSLNCHPRQRNVVLWLDGHPEGTGHRRKSWGTPHTGPHDRAATSH